MSNAGVINVAGGGGGGSPVQTLTGNSGGPVPPTANNINIIGNGPTTVTGNPGTSTLTVSTQVASAQILSSVSNAGIASFSGLDFAVDGNGFVTLVGGETFPAVQRIFVDETSGGGSDPIESDPAGQITITGSLVNFGTHAKAVSTNSATDPNEFTIDVQIASTAAASTRTANGLSHFNSSEFTINTDGFVQLTGVVNVQTANATPQFVGTNPAILDFGLDNLLLGSSGTTITSGLRNVGLGKGALSSVTTGSNNVAVGTGALVGASTGSSQNIAIGDQALAGVTVGAVQNIVIGSQSGNTYASNESSNILLSNSGVVGESNKIRIGTQGPAAGQQTDIYLAGVLHTTSGRTVNVTTPGAYPYTTLTTDYVILVDTTSARTITPLASPATGTTYVIKDNVGSAFTNNITVTPSGKNIDGAASYVMNQNYGSITIIYNGTQWNVT